MFAKWGIGTQARFNKRPAMMISPVRMSCYNALEALAL
jgi:hypothetical protein